MACLNVRHAGFFDYWGEIEMIKNILCIELLTKIPNLSRFILMPRSGLLTIASIIAEKYENTGVAVKYIYEPFVGEIEINKIINFDPDIVLINGLTTSAPYNKYFIDELRKNIHKKFYVISGGEHATMIPDHAKTYSDFICMCEGDETIILLLEALDEPDREKQERLFSTIPNLYYKNGSGYWILNKKVKRVRNIDYRYNFEIVEKSKQIINTFPYSAIPLQTSRGCKFACSFCSWISLYGEPGYYVRPADDIIHDIDAAMNHTGIRLFIVTDNLFAGDISYTEKLLHRIIDEYNNKRLKPQLVVLCRADQFAGKNPFTDEFLILMKKAGVIQISIGVESVNEMSLKRMRKQCDLEMYKKACKRINEYGFRIAGTFVTAYGDDTYDDVMNIAGFAHEIGCYTIQVYAQNITPHTYDAKHNPHLSIPCGPLEYGNGHVPSIFPRNMMPSVAQKAIFDVALKFYDNSRHMPSFKNLLQYLYGQIWESMQPVYRAFQAIEENILLPKKIYISGSGGGFILQEEALINLYNSPDEYLSFSDDIEHIFKKFCRPPIGNEYHGLPPYWLK
jgi:radical SAM superfamily enzyme YgiQ (UPF0313 family)